MDFQPQIEEAQHLKEHELNRREEYLCQLEAELQQKEEILRQAAEIHERLLPQRRESHAQMLEQQAMKEKELNRREEYLRHLETELQQKEDIRVLLRFKSVSTGEEEMIEASRKSNMNQKDTGSSAVKQTETSGSDAKGKTTGSSAVTQTDTSSSDGKQKEISPFLKPYINFFSGTEPVPKNENNFEEWKVEIECLRKSTVYPEYIVNQALRNSLKGQARRVLFTLGPEATTE